MLSCCWPNVDRCVWYPICPATLHVFFVYRCNDIGSSHTTTGLVVVQYAHSVDIPVGFAS